MDKSYINKIFLIDDDEMYSSIIKDSIEQNELYDVQIFENGEAFFNQIHQACILRQSSNDQNCNIRNARCKDPFQL